MKLQKSVSKNAVSYYIAKTIYTGPGKTSSRIVERLGSLEDIKERSGDMDPLEWAKAYVQSLTEKDKSQQAEVLVKYVPHKQLTKDVQHTYYGGYMFLQKIYHDLGLHKIADTISSRHKFTYDLNAILSRLIYGRILFPSSKLSTYEVSKKYLEEPNFELHHIYRALSVLAKEEDYIQSELYKNSLKLAKRATGVLYYDCTNFFFEIEAADGDKQYGHSKDFKPNPIVQMGLFMDGDGMPLAYSINPGNTNEQVTLKPLEQKLLKDFEMSDFVVCTDGGLSSESNRKFNTKGGRHFITVQSLKGNKVKSFISEWALGNEGWYIPGDKKIYDISKIDEEKCKNITFYKERWMNENGLEQRIIVTYSLKYRNYQRHIRAEQLIRAGKIVNNPSKIKAKTQNDHRRFVTAISTTDNGEVAENISFELDIQLADKESVYDGFYAVCTDLEDDPINIIKCNERRWKIEECFRIMKHEFEARPVNLSRDDRIRAHFATCFIALLVFRILESKLGSEYTPATIIDTLKDMNFLKTKSDGYIPEYTRTDMTDALHDAFGFRTDYEILSESTMKKIFKLTKK